MSKTLKRVRPKDFDVKALLMAAREGRLYVDEREKKVSRDDVVKEVRAYVEHIRPFVCKQYRSSIDELWETIFDTDVLMDMLLPKPKARLCRKFDKYSVMRIVGVLREKGVYEERSTTQFDALLETPGRDSPYRRYLGQGFEEHTQMLALRSVVEKFNILVN